MLEKVGFKPFAYAGVATDSQTGQMERKRQYDTNATANIPQLVREKLEAGYAITHMGALAWMDLPTYALCPRLRLLSYAIETCFMLFFWTLNWSTPAMHGEKAGLCFFDREALEYGGLYPRPSYREGSRKV